VGGILIDLTPPSVTLLSPPDGGKFTVGTVLTPSYFCQDSPSGLAGCSGSVPSGQRLNLNTPGEFSFTVTATDVAGNTTSVTHNYTVVAAVGGG
jgi:hypothetical protein